AVDFLSRVGLGDAEQHAAAFALRDVDPSDDVLLTQGGVYLADWPRALDAELLEEHCVRVCEAITGQAVDRCSRVVSLVIAQARDVLESPGPHAGQVDRYCQGEELFAGAD